MPQRLAVVAVGQPCGHRDAGGQLGRRGRRGLCRAGQDEIRHEISFGEGWLCGVGAEAAEVDDHDAVALLRASRSQGAGCHPLHVRRELALGRLGAPLPRTPAPARLACLLGGLALPHAPLGLAVGEDLAEIARTASVFIRCR